MQASEIKEVTKSEMMDKAEVKSSGISYKTVGSTLQALSVQLDENESVFSEVGKMSWMTDNIKMQTRGQSFGKMMSRMFAAESLFINEFTCTSGTGIVSFSTEEAGKIIPLEFNADSPGIMFQRGSYLTSEAGVERTTTFNKKISAGLFGGKGFILQKLKGVGKAHLIANGEVVMYELQAGEKILVDQGNLIAYEETVDFDIQTVGGGVKNWLFGGEGIFLGVMTGPGKVWLQTRKQSIISAAMKSQYGASTAGRGGANNPLGCLIGIGISIISIIFFILIAVIGSMS